MNTSLIPVHEFVGVDAELASERKALAIAAETVLGYSKLRESITPGRLLTILQNLDIHPLRADRVQAYKKTKEHTSMWSGVKKGLKMIPFSLGTLLASIWLWTHLYNPPASASAWLQTLSFLGVLFASSFSFGAVTLGVVNLAHLFDDELKGERTVWAWKEFRMDSYPGNIELHALNKMIQIKTAEPMAVFHIEQLMENRELAPDPFLRVSFGSGRHEESYYIDWWDEANYPSFLD